MQPKGPTRHHHYCPRGLCPCFDQSKQSPAMTTVTPITAGFNVQKSV